MRIVLLCATRRGYLFLQKLFELAPECEIVVFSFRETPWEPPFLEDIRALTLENGGQFLEARNVAADEFDDFWASNPVDLMFLVSWRYIVPSRIYEHARIGTFVFHDALLPKYRGFAPTVWSIINGEDHTGVTLFEIAEEVDAGDIVAQQKIPIGADQIIVEIIEAVTAVYLDLLEKNLAALMNENAPRIPQDHSQATFTCKWLPEDSEIDWHQSSVQVHNLIRASSQPYPGAFTFLNGEKLTIWSAELIREKIPYVGRVIGRVVKFSTGEGAIVLTGDGVLRIKTVQRINDPEPLPAENVLNSPSITLGRNRI